MENLVTFLNSSLGLLLIGSIIGAIGLFTWQRQDWLFKQTYLRTQVMIDRRLKTIEQINADVGNLLAVATSVAVVILKKGSADQRNEAIKRYNDQQVEWFAASSSHEPLLAFYFSQDLSEAFVAKIFGAYENIDIQLTKYQRSPDSEHYKYVYDALQNLKKELRSWNRLAMKSLYEVREPCGFGPTSTIRSLIA